MSLVSKIRGRGPSGFGYGSTAEEVTAGLQLAGRTYLVTGSNSGLGMETARVLLMRGAHVLAAGRTADKVRAACAWMGDRLEALSCELSEPSSVRACVADVAGRGVLLDGIICNAGIMALPKLEHRYGLELQFLTNHIGHFMLVTGLLEWLTPEARVVVLSSGAHAQAPREGIQFDNLSGDRGYVPYTAYGQSKLANLLFARELARRFGGTRRTANSVHPGVVMTALARSMAGIVKTAIHLSAPLFVKNVAEGAATQTYVATHPSLAAVTGEYFSHCNVARSTKQGMDMAMAARLWEVSEKIVAGLPS